MRILMSPTEGQDNLCQIKLSWSWESYVFSRSGFSLIVIFQLNILISLCNVIHIFVRNKHKISIRILYIYLNSFLFVFFYSMIFTINFLKEIFNKFHGSSYRNEK